MKKVMKEYEDLEKEMGKIQAIVREDILKSLTVQEKLQGLKPEERLIGLKPEERLIGLKPEERFIGLSQEEKIKIFEALKKEIENGYMAAGKKLYGARRYPEAIEEWDKAKPYTSNISYLNKLVSRAREQMKAESEEKKRRGEEAARRARTEEERRAREEADRKKTEEEARRKGVSAEEVVKKPQGISEEKRLSAQQHYLEGLKFFQNSNYEKARDEWTVARQLDPENSDVASGLKRIEQILSGGQ